METIIVSTRNLSERVDVLQLNYVSYTEPVTQSNITSQKKIEKQKLSPKFLTGIILKSFVIMKQINQSTVSFALKECRNWKSSLKSGFV